MMKKRLLAFGLAGVMLMGMSMNVFAANEDVENMPDNSNQDKTLAVEYVVPVSYTISIPTALTFNSKDSTQNILKFEQKALILNDKGQVTIKIKSGTSDIDLKLNGNDSVKYTVNLKDADGLTAINKDEVAKFTNTSKEATKVKVVSDQVATVAGTYNGSVDFTISYTENTTSE